MHWLIGPLFRKCFVYCVHGSLWYVFVVSLWLGVMGRLAGNFYIWCIFLRSRLRDCKTETSDGNRLFNFYISERFGFCTKNDVLFMSFRPRIPRLPRGRMRKGAPGCMMVCEYRTVRWR